MQVCHACKRELIEESLVAGQCVHCGATVRPLAQQTIELPQQPEHGPSEPDHKSPTVAVRADMTMEYQSPPEPAPAASDGESSDSGNKPAGRSTHAPATDITVELGIAPADAERISVQWGGTFDRGTQQGHTIRQRETVTGFRSSLPVKSRFIRSRDAGRPTTLPKSAAEVPDYELLDIIGEGGMGVVYAAHQSSIARTVAVKMLKPSAKVGEEQRDKFISEAVVTGELDHPNIVPIYDLGANDQGALFYSMKRVRGTPWSKVLHQNQLDNNLGILLRVADAVAFAHAGGVIHRDLKPENVMLGDYGEVLVMDWGLARITSGFAHADAVHQADSLGGTPAYMAPEMARGPVEAIDKTSDIYLLGAMLYEIIGNHPPHSGKDVMQCLMAASQNRIDPIRHEGELKDIALRAMATRQDDRYQGVKEFQEAIRTYQSHSESLVLTAHANHNLRQAREGGDYALYARALYGFQESLTLWDANQQARALLGETRHDYAQCALGKGDFDLAASLLETTNANHQPLLAEIDAARADREARARRLKYAKRAVAALLATVAATITIAYFNVRAARNDAVHQRDIAVDAREKEAEARGEAVVQRDAAVTAREAEAVARTRAEEQEQIARREEQRAKEQEQIAREQERLAVAAKQAEEYEAYVARIGLAAAKTDENAYDFAQQLLAQCKPVRRDWEWGRLAYLCQLSAATYDAAGPVDAVAFSPDGGSFVSGDWGGQVTVRDVKTGTARWQAPHGQYVMSVAYSPDGHRIAAGSSDRTIKIFDANDGRVLSTLDGHTDGVLSVRFAPDGQQLVSGSYDNTARIWDLASGETQQVLRGHSWWVWTADFSPDSRRIVTAGQDGKAIVWEEQGADNSQQDNTPGSPLPAPRSYSRLTEFTGHDGAVYSARFSPQGNLIATGGYDKMAMIWNPDEVQPVDIRHRLEGAPDLKPNYLRLTGHDGPVRSVAFSPNGSLVLSGSEENTLRLWDATTGEPLKTLRGHGNAIRSAVFSPDGRWVLSGSQDERVRLWDIEGYQEVRVLRATVLAGHDDAVLSARFSADGKQIVTASRDRTASLWDAATGVRLRQFVEGHQFLASSAVFFGDGRRLATAAGDNSVRLWDLTTGTQTAVLAPTGRIGTLAVSPDGDWLVTGSPTTEARLWDTRSGQPTSTLGGHVAEVSAVAFSPTGDRLVTGDDRGHLRGWRRGVQAGEWTFDREFVGHNGGITGIRFTPNGKRLVTSSGDRSCGQWDLEAGRELRDLVLKHPDWVSSLDVSPDGRLALTTCDDGHVRLWRLEDARQVASFESPEGIFNSVSFSPDSRLALVTSSADKQVRIWDLAQAAEAAEDEPSTAPAGTETLFDFNKLGGLVWSAMFAPDGRHVLTIGGNDAQLWNLQTRRPAIRFSPHGAVASAAISPDGRQVATGSWDHSAKLWDAASGSAVRKFDGGHVGYINTVEFSPDGRELLTASDDGTARLWNVESGQPTGVVFRGHTARVIAATYSADAARVLTTSGDKTSRLWDHATGQMIRELKGHSWAVLCGQFSPDGQRVITGSQDNTAKLWDAATGKELITLGGHTAPITSVAFSPEGTRVLTGSRDNTAKLWDSATGKEILSLPGHSQEVTAVSFSPDGRSVLTASRDGTAIIWPAVEWRGTEPPQTAQMQ